MKNATWAVRTAREALERAENGEVTPPAPSLIPTRDYIDMAAAETEALQELERHRRRLPAHVLSLAEVQALSESQQGKRRVSAAAGASGSLIAAYTSTLQHQSELPGNVSLQEGLLENYRQRRRADVVVPQLRDATIQLLQPSQNVACVAPAASDIEITAAREKIAQSDAHRRAAAAECEAAAEAHAREVYARMAKWRCVEADQIALQQRQAVERRLAVRQIADTDNAHSKSMEVRMREIAAVARANDEARRREQERIACLVAASRKRVDRELFSQQEASLRGSVEADEQERFLGLLQAHQRRCWK